MSLRDLVWQSVTDVQVLTRGARYWFLNQRVCACMCVCPSPNITQSNSDGVMFSVT